MSGSDPDTRLFEVRELNALCYLVFGHACSYRIYFGANA